MWLKRIVLLAADLAKGQTIFIAFQSKQINLSG